MKGAPRKNHKHNRHIIATHIAATIHHIARQKSRANGSTTQYTLLERAALKFDKTESIQTHKKKIVHNTITQRVII